MYSRIAALAQTRTRTAPFAWTPRIGASRISTHSWTVPDNSMFRGIVRAILVAIRAIPRPDLIARVIQQHPTPQQVSPGVLTLVIDAGHQKWACFRCPCGCNDRIQLSLNPNRRPRWSVRMDWLHRPTVSPSVNQTTGCRSHFWIRSGQIEWCARDI
ncbi:MAG: DUF6527 family protein [Pseudomonadota bacterium]